MEVIDCGSKMTEEEIDKLQYIVLRPTDGWNVTMKMEHIESFNGHVFAEPNGIMNNGANGDGYSRFNVISHGTSKYE